MQIKEFIAKYNNHPVLFIGTGLSLRYLKNSYSWDNLLKQIILHTTGNEEDNLNIKSRHQKDGYYQYPEMSSAGQPGSAGGGKGGLYAVSEI